MKKNYVGVHNITNVFVLGINLVTTANWVTELTQLLSHSLLSLFNIPASMTGFEPAWLNVRETVHESLFSVCSQLQTKQTHN